MLNVYIRASIYVLNHPISVLSFESSHHENSWSIFSTYLPPKSSSPMEYTSLDLSVRKELPKNTPESLFKVDGYLMATLIFIVTFISRALKVRSGWTRFAFPWNIFPRLDSVPINVPGNTAVARSVLPFIAAVAQKGFLALVHKFFAFNAESYHFSCSSSERMKN